MGILVSKYKHSTLLRKRKICFIRDICFIDSCYFYLCDSFKYGHLKAGDVVVSQWIAMFIVNFITYMQLCLLANQLLNPLGMFTLMGADVLLCLICTYIYTAIYHSNYVPRNMIMIYGNDNAIYLKLKMESRKDKYHVTALVNIDKGIDYIKKKL